MLTNHKLKVLHPLILLMSLENMSGTNPNDQPKKDRMVHASFRKVVAFDLFFFALGILVGIGIGVYLIAR